VSRPDGSPHHATLTADRPAPVFPPATGEMALRERIHSHAWLEFDTLRVILPSARRCSGSTAEAGSYDAHHLDERIAAYRSRRITNPQAHDLLIKAVDCRAITPTQVPDVLHEWRQPEHDDFRPRNAWSLFNACTDVFMGIIPHSVVNRSQALLGLFDGLVGLS
jgi:hypothetical protein